MPRRSAKKSDQLDLELSSGTLQGSTTEPPSELNTSAARAVPTKPKRARPARTTADSKPKTPPKDREPPDEDRQARPVETPLPNAPPAADSAQAEIKQTDAVASPSRDTLSEARQSSASEIHVPPTRDLPPHNPLPDFVRPNFLASASAPVTAPSVVHAPAALTASPPRSTPHNPPPEPRRSLLKSFDYSILQQCMHCGLCLPACPTYDATSHEKNSPRGRIALMRAIADDKLETTRAFADEMYFCLGCLACQTACPAGVDYAHLFEMARADAEASGMLRSPKRDRIRYLVLKVIFMRPWLLKLIGRLLWLNRVSGLQWLSRKLNLIRFLPDDIRRLEPQTPRTHFLHSNQRIRPLEEPGSGPARYRVGLLTGCVQDICFPDINRDTATALLAAGCAVVTPRNQPCCGSLHAHNGDLDSAKIMARRNIDAFDLDALDAIITNAAGCGSHLKHYDRLLKDDPLYSQRAAVWSAKVRDIHEWLVEIGFPAPPAPDGESGNHMTVTYHEACHLCHGQNVTAQPRTILKAIPGLELRALEESTWCCGSAGNYNITQPEMAGQLLERKLAHVATTQAECVATANPGCMLQIQFGLRQKGRAHIHVRHPISLLAAAYRPSDTASQLARTEKPKNLTHSAAP